MDNRRFREPPDAPPDDPGAAGDDEAGPDDQARPAGRSTGSTTRRAGIGERFRKRESEVVDAAIKVFFRRGYAAASIQDVADEVGVLKGSLYYYIKTKEDLLVKIFDESHRQAAEIISELEATQAPAIDRLRRFVERYVTWYLHNFERTTLYFNEWQHLTGARRRRVIAQRRAYDEFVRNLVVAAQSDGHVDPQMSPKYASFLIHGAVNAVSNWYRRGGEETPEQIAAVYGKMLTGMLTAGPAERPRPARG